MENKFTNFLSCFYANTPQNTGGGNSHSSTVVTPVWKGSRPTVSRQSTDSQSQDHRNHTPISKALKYAAMLLMILTLGVSQMWGETTTWTHGFEDNTTWGGSNTSNRANNATAKRTGSKGAYATASNGSGRLIKGGSVDMNKDNTYTVMCWMKSSVAGKAGVNIAAAGGEDFDIAANTWTLIYKQLTPSSAQTGKNIQPTIKISANCTIYVDDVVFYKGTVDLVKPTQATSASGTTSKISWTCGTDANTGIQNTLIWKRTTAGSDNLSLNDQGVYAVNDNDQSGKWTLVNATVAADATSYSGSFEEDEDYAIVHRDLAYNYSSPAYVTIPGGAPVVDVTPPTLSSSSPADEATNVATSGTIVLTFSEAIASVDATKFTLTGATKGDVAIDGTDATKVNIAYSGAEYEATIKLETAAGAVSDASSNASAALSDISFTIESAPVFTASSSVNIEQLILNNAGNKNAAGQFNDIKSAFDEAHIDYDLSAGCDRDTLNDAADNKGKYKTNRNYAYLGLKIKSADKYVQINLPSNKTLKVKFGNIAANVKVTIGDADPVNHSSGDYELAADPSNNRVVKLATSTDGAVVIKQIMIGEELQTVTLPAKITLGSPENGSISVESTKVNVGSSVTVTVTPDDGYSLSSISVTRDTIGNPSAEVTSNSFTMPNGNVTINATFTPTPSCAATVPGNISKGTASGGTGTITLTATGDIASGDAWYWQSAADGTATNLGSGKTKDVNAAGTYYIRSYNATGTCWSAAKSVEVVAADLLTAISPTLSYDANVIVGNTASPTLEGNAGSGSVTYALNDVTPAGSLTINSETGVVTAVTAGGTATVTATIAANGNYAAGAATSETITVVAPTTGTATVSFALSGSTTTGTVSGISTISGLSSSLTLSTLTIGDAKSGYSGAIKGCTSETELVEDDYVDVQFTVASGYVFTPSEVSVKANPLGNTSNLKAVVKIMDAQPLEVASEVLSCTKNTDNLVTFASGAFTNKEFCGTVHIRIYFYGTASNKEFWIKSPITIAGTVAVAVTKYDLSFAAGTGASGSMSTLKYAEGAEVTLPACTFTAPTGKEFDAWVVTKTVGGASVTVEDGVFTMPAEAVTATATWKDRAKHTDATLSDLTVGGETVTGFAAATTSYNVELPFGTFAAPTVDATATDAEYVKSVVVTQASSASGDATVVVTAEDGTTTKTYTVHFSVEASKDIELVWATDKQRCDGTTPSAKALIATASTYLSASYTGSAAEGGSLTTNKTTGSKIIITAQPGYAFKAMGFYGKIEDGTCNFYNDGVVETIGTSTGDACYSDVFSNDEVHEFVIELTGSNGVYIRNMQLTMIQACTPKTIAWTAEPAAEYEVGASVDPIAASANNGTVTYASNDGDVIAVNSSNGALTVSSLGTVTLSASVPAGDGTTYCATAANIEKTSINTYYLVTFDKQNGESAIENKYYKNDEAIALPSTPSYSGFNFLGWFDASTGGNAVTSAITPTASRTIYAQWEATCDGPMITTQSGSRTYFVGREAATLVGEASAAGEGELTYTWYSCDDAERTNPESLAGAPTPSTAVAGTQYYYFTVTEAGCDVVASSDVIVITVEEKDPVCIIKATPTSSTEATVDGAYKGNAFFKGNSKMKLNSGYDYVGVDLASGYTFLATDKVVLNQAADLSSGDISKFYIYKEVPADDKLIVTVNNDSPVKGDNWFYMPAEMAGESAFYIGRVDAKCNPTVGYLAVYRTMMPELLAISINDRAGELDALAENTFNVTIPFEADLASLTVVPTIARNAAHATTPQAVITNDGAWVLGNNTYRVMDKDGDYTDYNIVLTRDVLKYTVSYNMHGGTPAIDDELVVAGGKIAAAPADPTREDYIFQGWSLTDGGDIIDIAKVTIDEDKVFHAVWVSDGGIKLLDGSTVNTTNFITGVTATTVSISGDDYDCVAFGGTVNNVNASNMKNLNSHVTYNATTTQTKIRLSLFNSNGSKRTIYVKGVVEGTDNIVDLAAIELNGNEKKTTEYIEFNNAKNRSIYIFVSSNAGDIKILQVKVMEEGAALKKAGEIGYSLNMNKGRMFGASGATINFEGLSYTLSNDYTPLNSTALKLKSSSISFATTVPVQLSVTTATTDKTYYITRGSEGTDNPNTRSTKLNLAEPGTWYITAGSSEVSITGISFDYPQVEITENATDAAIIAGADVKVKDGKELTLDDVHTIHDLIVEEGGKVTLNNTLTVENLYLEAQAGASGQVLGATNVTANAVYMDVTFFKGATELDETTAGRWYMISAPFDVNLADGFYKTDGTPMVFGQTDGENIFDLFEYDGNKRATTGVTGWKRVQGKMKAGRACLIGFNPEQPTTIRLKAASTVLSEPTSIALNEYAGDDANRNWNGVANPTMHYTDLSCDVQTYNNEDGENGRKYISYSASSTSFVVGTAFFVQETGTLTLSAATHGSLRAPKRESERYEACVQIFRDEATEFADQMYVRASETASNEYEQGHDMITWNGTTANTALIWANNYGKRLAIEEAPMVNDKATYNLGIFVPVAGTYRIEVANPNDDATLYLTKNGRIFWNLTMGACELDLAQGQNNEYGLLLRAEAPAVTTGMDEVRSEAGVQKLIIDENVFILRGEQLFDMTGKLVK